MFTKLITIFICFNIVIGSRIYPKLFNNVEDNFVELDGIAKLEDHGFKSAKCGKPSVEPNALRRIMGGVEAKPHSWPWQISVQNSLGDHFSYFCGGTIISATRILSAAHCLFDNGKLKPLTNLFVVAGIHDLFDSFSLRHSQTKQVIRVVAHDGFDPMLHTNAPKPYDIAVLDIASPGFTFNDKVQPACLPTSPVPDGTSCYATGFGNIQLNQVNTLRKLNQVSAPIISSATCSSWYGLPIEDYMLCAGYPEGGKAPCQGDSGGPLVCNEGGEWVVHGVTSWSKGCGVPKKPVVYSRVYNFVNWINSIA